MALAFALAKLCGAWQQTVMIDKTPPPQKPANASAGGVFIALGMLIGAVVGIRTGEASLGMVIGVGAGMVAALAVWVIRR